MCIYGVSWAQGGCGIAAESQERSKLPVLFPSHNLFLPTPSFEKSYIKMSPTGISARRVILPHISTRRPALFIKSSRPEVKDFIPHNAFHLEAGCQEESDTEANCFCSVAGQWGEVLVSVSMETLLGFCFYSRPKIFSQFIQMHHRELRQRCGSHTVYLTQQSANRKVADDRF